MANPEIEPTVVQSYTELQQKCPDAKGWAVDADGNFTPLYY